MLRDYGRIAFFVGITVAAIVGSLVYYFKLSTLEQQKDTLLEHIENLKDINKRIDLHIYGMHAHFNRDAMNRQIILFEEYLDLSDPVRFENDIYYDRFRELYNEIDSIYQQKIMYVEDLKISDAVISNSIAFLIETNDTDKSRKNHCTYAMRISR